MNIVYIFACKCVISIKYQTIPSINCLFKILTLEDHVPWSVPDTYKMLEGYIANFLQAYIAVVNTK